MRLKDEHVKRYQQIFKREFGKEINHEQAYDECLKLVLIMKIVYKPVEEKDIEGLRK